VHTYTLIRPLQEAMQANLERVGPPRFDEADQAFARELSYITPTVEFSVTTAAEHIPWHSWATSASHGTSGAVKGAQVATKALALMGAELILDAELLRRAREAHAEATDGVPYRSPIPEGQQVPLPTRD